MTATFSYENALVWYERNDVQSSSGNNDDSCGIDGFSGSQNEFRQNDDTGEESGNADVSHVGVNDDRYSYHRCSAHLAPGWSHQLAGRQPGDGSGPICGDAIIDLFYHLRNLYHLSHLHHLRHRPSAEPLAAHVASLDCSGTGHRHQRRVLGIFDAIK